MDGDGAAYVTGSLEEASQGFPTTNGAFDRSRNGSRDVFLTKLNAAGDALSYSTFLGGRRYDGGNALAVDSSGAVLVTGATDSADFPTTYGSFDTLFNDTEEAFIAKINPDPSFAAIPDPLEFIEKPSRGQAGFGVDTGSGMYMYRWTDLAIPGRGPSPVFARAYNSADLEVGPLGPSWTHSYNSRIVQDATGNAIVVAPNGRRGVYTPQGSGTFAPPTEITSVLTQDTATGIYTLVHQDQSVWTYDAQGKLTSIKDRFGNESTLSYDTSGRLTSISDPAGRGSLTLAYDTCFTGRLCSVSDWLSPARTVQYQYDTEGRLWKFTDREGKVTTFGYDGPSHRLTTITDANSHVAIAIDYDTQGRVTEQKDARGIATDEKTTFAYTANPDGTTTTTVLYPTTSFEPSYRPVEIHTYDTQGRLVQRVIEPTSNSNDDVSIQYAYDVNGFVTAITDGRGNTTNFCYDVDYAGSAVAGSRGNLTRRIDPAPSPGANRPVTLYNYDAKNNLIQAIPPKGVTSGTTVVCATNLSTNVNLTYATDSTYDAATQTKLESVTRTYVDPDTGSPVSAVTKFEFNDSSNPGLVTKIIPPRGNTGGTPDYTYATSFTYFTTGSKAGLLESVTDPVGNKTTYDYDAVGRVTTMVDPLGNALGGTPADHTWEYSYDNEDRLRFAKAPAPSSGGSQPVTEFRYDAVGNRTVVIDANGQVTKYLYDERDSLKEVWESPNPWTDPAVEPSPKFVTAYNYDHLGNLSRATRAKDDSTYERAVDYVYDGLNRLRTETQYPSWPTTTPTLVTPSTYDANSNRKTLVDPLGQTTTFGYDALNRLTSINYSDTGTPDVSYQYDANGNRTQMVDGTGTTTYSYDELDRLISVTSPGPKTVGYRYDRDGNRTKVIYPDSTAVTYTFDKASRLDSLLDWASRTTSYEYFADGSLKRITNPNGTIADYTYDNARRLTDVWNQQSTNTISRHTYTVDAVGNRTQVDELLPVVGPPGTTTTRQTTYDYDRVYRLTGATVPSGPTTYTYDPVGNRLSMTRGGTTTSYGYDRADRITLAGAVSYSVNANGNVVARGTDTFSYDQANRLKSATIEGVTSTYAYDGDGKRTSKTVGSTTSYVYDVNASLPVVLDDGARTYVYGLGLAYAVNGTTIEVYHTDGLGSVRAITDASGNVVQTYLNDEFGDLLQTSGTNDQPFQFTGQQRDAESGFYYLRARMYDPATGRFLSRDPFAGVVTAPQTLNRYAYVGNNPMNLTDPSGLFGYIPIRERSYPDWWPQWAKDLEREMWQSGAGLPGPAALEFASFRGVGAVATTTVSRGQVAVDANALIRALDYGELAALRDALGGRIVVVPITAAKEYLKKGSSTALREFMRATHARIGRAGSAEMVRILQREGLKAADAWVASSALREGVPLITRDKPLRNFLEFIGVIGESF